jgi:hypothetical protein
MPDPTGESGLEDRPPPAGESFIERVAREEAEERAAWEREAQDREKRAQRWRAARARARAAAAGDPTNERNIARDERINEEVRDVMFRIGVELGHEGHKGLTPSQYGAAVTIGSVLPTSEREAAYLKVRAMLDTLGTPALKSSQKQLATLRDYGGKPYVEQVFAAGVDQRLAVVERCRPARRGQPGELLDAAVVVLPGGAFQKNPRWIGRDRMVPSSALREWLHRSFPPMPRDDIQPPPPQDPRPFLTLMRSVGVYMPDDPENPYATPPPGAPGSPVWDPEVHGDTPPRTGYEAPGDEPPPSPTRHA